MTLHGAFSGATTCTVRGKEDQTIVAARAIGYAAEPTKADLERRIAELEEENARLRDALS